MIQLHSNIACLEKLIGLSRNDCECIQTGRPEDYSDSLSGLYMDDYEHGIPWIFPKSAKDCGDNNTWDVLRKARVEGMNDSVTHLLGAIGKNRNSFVDGFSGDFGEVNKRTTNVIDKSCKKALNGFTFSPNVYKGASIKIKKIWLGVDVAATYSVKIHDLKNTTTALDSFDIAHTGNQNLVSVNVNKIYPLSEAGQKVSYSFSYERGSSYPLDIAYYCGCGNDKKPLWMKSSYFESGGFCVDSMSEVIPSTLSGNGGCCNRKFTGGLIVEWEMVCDPASWMCGQDNSFWVSTQWGRIAAKAAQLICSVKSISAVLNSGNVNFYTQMMAEDLAERRKSFSDTAMELIDYLGSNMPEHVSHCWRCQPDHDFKKQTIRI